MNAKDWNANIRSLLPKSIPLSAGGSRVGEKLRELFRRQDVRDKAVKAFHEHKKAQARAASGRPKAA